MYMSTYLYGGTYFNPGLSDSGVLDCWTPFTTPTGLPGVLFMLLYVDPGFILFGEFWLSNMLGFDVLWLLELYELVIKSIF